MKRPFLLFCGIAFIIVESGFVQDWVTYKSDAGHCSIQFPAKPDEQAKNYDKFTLHLATYEDDGTGYVFGWSDLTQVNIEKPVSEVLSTCKGGMVKKASSVTMVDSNYTSRTPYLDFNYRTENKLNVARVYYIHKVLYQLVCTYDETKTTRSNPDRFIHSFKSLW